MPLLVLLPVRRNLRRLGEATKRLAAGDLSARVGMHPNLLTRGKAYSGAAGSLVGAARIGEARVGGQGASPLEGEVVLTEHAVEPDVEELRLDPGPNDPYVIRRRAQRLATSARPAVPYRAS